MRVLELAASRSKWTNAINNTLFDCLFSLQFDSFQLFEVQEQPVAFGNGRKPVMVREECRKGDKARQPPESCQHSVGYVYESKIVLDFLVRIDQVLVFGSYSDSQL